MADTLRGHLAPLVLCCVSGSITGWHAESVQAAQLPPLLVDPALTSHAAAPLAAPVASEPKVAPNPAPLRPTSPISVVPSTPALTASALGTPQLAATSRLLPEQAGESFGSFLYAQRLTVQDENLYTLEGQAEFRQKGALLTAERIRYQQDQDLLEAEGQVSFQSRGDSLRGPKMSRKLGEATGTFFEPDYVLRGQQTPGQPLPRDTGYGHAEKMVFEGEQRYRLVNTRYTTCEASDPDWYSKMDELYLDYGRSVGEGKNTTVYFKDTPILHLPSMSFALSKERKSGFLTPTLTTSSTSGLDFTLPYYWNIAPNMDATLYPRLLTRRGVQLGSELRYLEPTYNGIVRYDILPRDSVYGASRSAYSLLHNHNLGDGFSANLNLNGVSDDRYFADLGTSIASTAQSTLVRQGQVSYSHPLWNATMGVQRYQTLQDASNPTTPPYDRLPFMRVSANSPYVPGGMELSFSGNFDQFAVSDPNNANRPEGRRVVAYPQIALPLQYGGVSVTPKVGYHLSSYALSKVQTAGDPTSINRALPIFSVDTALNFERDTQWQGRDFVQTLEPRLYYLYVPAKDQSAIPVFDSGLKDFYFAQFFSENAYSGNDRIADANQITAAVTSRLIDPSTGGQLLSASLGQRFYFTKQAVTLPGETARTTNQADILAALTGKLRSDVSVDTGWQYNPGDNQTQRFTISTRYQPEAYKALNVAYRYKRDSVSTANDGFKDFDISTQWPIMGGWHALGRYNYSLHDKRLVQSIIGAEYDGGCWAGRLVLQRFATTSTSSTSTLFFQLELNGFSRIGNDPYETLRRSISGYNRVNSMADAPLFGVE